MTDRDTIKLIVRYLGRAAIIDGIITGALVGLVIWLSRGRGTVDAAAVALVGLAAQPAMAAITALPAILASTRSTPDRGEIDEALAGFAPPAPTAVRIDQPDDQPVPVAETPAPAD